RRAQIDWGAPTIRRTGLCRGGCMRTLKKFWIVMAMALGVLASATAIADASYREQMKGLDEQVQEVKSDVLGLAAERARLEERLLYPSNTHLAVFMALARRALCRRE